LFLLKILFYKMLPDDAVEVLVLQMPEDIAGKNTRANIAKGD